eukprot:TRINITY_DN1729_c0_g1_i1.p1 TRINITY_DN1729_c0_g1~~TRINITY_DN1729_c0_g1_i1.p1  ORF type:complete len:794 (-),score=261.17 TRINITY_DN1729_c0_g1_i1:54-2435(-)
MSARPVRTVTAAPKDALDARLRSGSMVGNDSPASPSRTTWSPSKLKKVQAQEARLNPVLGGLPPNEAASTIINEGMNSTIKHFRMINVKEHADAQFNVGGNLLYAHRCVINARCPALLTKFVKEKQIKKGVTYIKVDDKQIDDPTLYAVLHYLYSDELLFHTMESSQVVNLLRAAQQYEVPRLAWLAERYLKSIITMDNFFVLLKVAATGTVVRAKTLCMEFGAKHFKEIIVRKDGVTSLGLDLFREFVEFVVIPPPEGKKIDVDPETKNIPSTIEEDFTKIYNDMSLTDGAAMLTGDKQPVRFHCAFVLETAPTLSAALSLSKDTSEEHREQMILDLPKNAQLSAGAFRALLRFIYYADKSIEPVHAAELVPFARFYEIPALSDVVESIIKTGISVGSVIPILSLCYNKDVAKMVKNDVHNPSLRFVLNNFTEIDFKPLKKKSAAISFDILRLCKKQIEEGKWKRGDGSNDDEPTGNESAREHVSESEDRKKHKKEKEPEDDSVVAKDSLSPMRDIARGSSPRLSSRKPEVVETESAPNSPAEEPRRRRKVGKTRSLIEPSAKTETTDMSLSYVPPATEEKVSPVKKEKESKTTDDIVPPAPSKSSIDEAPAPAPASEEKQDTPKPAEPAGESAEKTEAKPEDKKADENKAEETKAEEKKEESKPAEPKAEEKKEEPKEEAQPAAEEVTEKSSKKDRKKKDDQPAEEPKAEAPAEPEKSSKKSRREEKEEDKKDKSPAKESKDSDSDSSRAAIRDKIKAFESQAKANAEEKDKLVRVPSQKNVATATVKPKK